MEQIAAIKKLENSLRAIELSESCTYIQDLITELHFAYQRFCLKHEVLFLSDQKTLWLAAHYLLTALVNSWHKTHLSEVNIEEGLAISGLIFELLGRYAQIQEDIALQRDCFLSAALANTFSQYEANATVLANEHFEENKPIFGRNLNHPNDISEYGTNLVFALLARKFFWIRQQNDLFLEVCNALDEIFHTPTNLFWISLCRGIFEFSVFMIEGAEEKLKSASDYLLSARYFAREHDMLSEHWLASRIIDCVNRMSSRSTWRLLGQQGFSDKYISTLTRFPWNPVHELWQSQIDALTKVETSSTSRSTNFLSEDVKRLVISMPTSAGKTLIAEMSIVHTLERNPGAKCVYVAPNRALVDEVETKLHRRLRFLGYKVSSVAGGFELDIADPNYLDDNLDVAVLTPEKLDYLFRKRDPFVKHVQLIIFDEMHKVAEGYRGWFLETLITWLLLKPQLQDVKMIFMSAVLPHSQQPLVRMWLGDQNQAPIVSSEWSPTRQLIGLLWYSPIDWSRPIGRDKRGNYCYETNANLTFRYDIGTTPRTLGDLYNLRFCVNEQFKQVGKDRETRYDRCYRLIKFFGSEQSILIYFQQKRELVNFCNYAPEHLNLIEDDNIKRLTTYISRRLGHDFPLVKSLPYGVAFHHGDLPWDVRVEIERAYQDKVIRVLACTTTLAEGVNLPIQIFVLGYHQTYYGHRLSVRDFKNIIGRAGRALVETEGKIIAIRHPEFSRNDEPSQYFEKLLNLEESALLLESELLPHDYQKEPENVIRELDALAETIKDAQSLAQQEYTEALADRIQRLQVFIFTLYEEGIQSIEAAMQKTLFFHQDTTDNIRNAISHLGTSFRTVCSQMDSDKLRRFNTSGLRYRSNALLEGLGQQIVQRSNSLSPAEYTFQSVITAEDFCFVLENIQEASLKSSEYQNNYATIQRLDHYGTLIAWLNGNDFAEIRDKYFTEISTIAIRTQVCQSYISKQFTFKLPWVFSGLQTHIEPQGNVPLSRWLSTLPALIKYGVNTPEAVYLSSIGVHSRFLAIALGQLYREEHGVTLETDWESLGDWFRGLNPFYLRDRLPDLPELAIRQAIRRANTIRPPSNQLRRDRRVTFDIAGWQYSEGETVVDELVGIVIGIDKPEVELQLEPRNLYDEYAVEIYWRSCKLGYVPRVHNEEIALLLVLGRVLRARIMMIESQRFSGWRPVQVMVELITEGDIEW